jgi:hypothetical protein
MSGYPRAERGFFEFAGQQVRVQRTFRGWQVSNGSRVIDDRFVGVALAQLLDLPKQRVLSYVVEVLEAQGREPGEQQAVVLDPEHVS